MTEQASGPLLGAAKSKKPAAPVVRLVSEYPLAEPTTSQRFSPGEDVTLIGGDITAWVQLQVDAGLMVLVE